MSESEIERIRMQLKRLALPTIAQRFEEAATKAAKSEQSYTAFLGGLADEELAAKLDRSVSIRLSKAGLPAIRTLEEFDFPFQPSLPAARIRELAELGFIDQQGNIVFVGRPGTGKTHFSHRAGRPGVSPRAGGRGSWRRRRWSNPCSRLRWRTAWASRSRAGGAWTCW